MIDGVDNLPPATAKPCNECPWRRDSLPGWLGPHSAEEWIGIVHTDTPIPCHKTIKQNGQPWSDLKQCRGAAIFRDNVFKSPRNPKVVTGPTDTVTVFADNKQFIAHHEHLRLKLERLTVAQLREEAWRMPARSKARKADIIDWLLRNDNANARQLVIGIR